MLATMLPEDHQMLDRKTVRDLMTREPVCVPHDINAQQLLDDWVYTHYHQFFPVLREGELIGGVSVNHLRALDRTKLRDHQVSDMMDPVSAENSIDADAPAALALRKMQVNRHNRLMVTSDGRLVGVLALPDLMKVIAFDKDFARYRSAGAEQI